MTNLAGSRLGGRYVLTSRLAFGGMGEVWRGTDDVLGRTVAVKILRPELADDNAFRRRFRAEARTAGGLSHPGIAAVYDYGEGPAVAAGDSTGDTAAKPPAADEDSVSYLVMELVPGEALSTIISREGALGVDRTLDLVAQTARALHAAHLRGVVHRDVKPANLMVTPDSRIKVTDFGIARPKDHEPLTMTGQVMGTAHYLAPELARGQSASPLSDVYALGVVMYECLVGHRPFDGENQVAVATAHLSQQPPPLPTTLDARVRRLVAAAMTKDPARRIQGADAFAVALEGLRATLASSQSPAATRVAPPLPVPSGRPGPVPGPVTDATVVSPEIPAPPAENRPATSTPTTPPSRPGVHPATGLTPMGKIRPAGAAGTSPVPYVSSAPSGSIAPGASDSTSGIGPADGGIGAPTMGFNSALISGPKPVAGIPGAGRNPGLGGNRSPWAQRMPVMIAVASMILLLGGVLVISQVWGRQTPGSTPGTKQTPSPTATKEPQEQKTDSTLDTPQEEHPKVTSSRNQVPSVPQGPVPPPESESPTSSEPATTNTPDTTTTPSPEPSTPDPGPSATDTSEPPPTDTPPATTPDPGNAGQ